MEKENNIMATTQTRNDLFTAERIAGMINKVKGHSSLAILSSQEPVAFNGNEIFYFNLDKDIDIVEKRRHEEHEPVEGLQEVRGPPLRQHCITRWRPPL